LAQVPAPAAIKPRLLQVANSYTAGNAFMGTVLVAEGDHILLDQGYGMADLEWNIPNAPDVKFRLGSLTKQFTATLVLLLQQDGKLHIEDPVGKYLPDAPKSWEKITLANLLGHTSGIPNFTSDKDFGTSGMSKHTTAEEIAFFRDKPLDFEQAASSLIAIQITKCSAPSLRRSAGKSMVTSCASASSIRLVCRIRASIRMNSFCPSVRKATAQAKMVWCMPARSR